MVEKDTIETKVIEKKEKVDEKIDEKKEKVNEKMSQSREKVNEKVEQGKNIADKMAEDFSKGVDDLILNVKSVQKVVDGKINDYKKAAVQSLDTALVEDDEKYYLKVAVPGVDKENIDIEAGESDISIVCTFTPFTEELEDVENPEVLSCDLKKGKCAKKVQFSNEIDTETIKAEYKNGVILITLTKIQNPKIKVDLK